MNSDSELGRLAGAVRDLTRRLQEMEDRAAIRELTARYNHAFDDVQPVEYAETFTADGTLQLGRDGQRTAGRDALARFNREFGFGLVHSTTDPSIAIHGDRATQVCNLILTTRTRDGAPGSVALSNTGRYHDELLRTPDGWRFNRRVWIPDQSSADE